MERVLKERILVHAGFYGKTNKIMQNSGPSSVHTWIKMCTQNLNNRSPLLKHVKKILSRK
jgi:hypothetical protein